MTSHSQFLFLAAFFFAPTLLAQELLWENNLGGSDYERIFSIVPSSDGGFAAVGESESSDGDVGMNQGSYDYWVVKLDSSGVLQWEKNFGGSSFDRARSIFQNSDGGFTVAGYTHSSDGDVGGNKGNGDYWVVKLDSNGTMMWEQNLGGSGLDEQFSAARTLDGGIVLAGASTSSDGDVGGNHGNSDYWVVKLDSNGIIQWEGNFGGSDRDYARSIIKTTNGGFIVAGDSKSSDGDVGGNYGSGDYWVIKLDSNGALQWEENFGGSDGERAYSIVQTLGGGFSVVGRSNSSDGDVGGNNGGGDLWALKLNSNGTLQWEENYGGSNDDIPRSIIQTSDKGLAIGGYTGSSDGDVEVNKGVGDFWAVKLDSNGGIQWEQTMGGSDYDYAHSMVQAQGGGFVMGGETVSSDGDVGGNNGNGDYWIVKLDTCHRSIALSPIVCDSSYTVPSGNDTLTTSGIYEDTILDPLACDSFMTIDLTFASSTDTTISLSKCDSYKVPSGDTTYTASGTYEDTISNAAGCDSIITIDLAIENSTANTISPTACNTYTVPSGDTSYTTSGTYEDTLTNSLGCDSILTIDLTIDSLDTTVAKVDPITLQADPSAASYRWLDCDSAYAPIIGDTSQQFTASSNGSYAVAITKNGCTDTSGCHSINSVGIPENDRTGDLSIVPNPTKDRVTLELSERKKPLSLTLRDITGRKLSRQRIENPTSFQLDLSGEDPGLYFVELEGPDGKRIVRKLVKE